MVDCDELAEIRTPDHGITEWRRANRTGAIWWDPDGQQEFLAYDVHVVEKQPGGADHRALPVLC